MNEETVHAQTRNGEAGFPDVLSFSIPYVALNLQQTRIDF